MSKIRIILPMGEIPVTGKQVSFKAPCACEEITSIIIGSDEFALVDACKNAVNEIPEVFAEGALISVVIDVEGKMAYIQNAANNRYGSPIKQNIVDGVANLEPILRQKYKVYADVSNTVDADYFNCEIKLMSRVGDYVQIATLPTIERTDAYRDYFDIEIIAFSRNGTTETVVYEIDGIRTNYSYTTMDSVPAPTRVQIIGANEIYTGGSTTSSGGSISDEQIADVVELYLVDYAKKTDIPSIPTKLSDLDGDSTHRTVTDAEKTAWNGKIDSSALAPYITSSKAAELYQTKGNYVTAVSGKGLSTNDLTNELKAKYDGKVDKTGISLGIASDGLIYVFVDGVPVGAGIPQGQSGDVFGYVDENNTVVLTGNLPDGTYTLKYEMDGDKVVNIGNMVLDSNVYYSVTSTLTNCSISNNTKTVVAGGSYSATITANNGYQIKSVTVTMGGSAVSVSGGVINIASVTGNIVITAVAEVGIVNQIPKSIGSDGKPYNGGTGYKTNTRLNSSGVESTDTGLEVTGFIPVKWGDTVRLKNIDWPVYSGSGACKAYAWIYESNFATPTLTAGTLCCIREVDDIAGTVKTDSNGKLAEFRITSTLFPYVANTANIAYVRVSAYDINSNSIITVNQEIV